MKATHREQRHVAILVQLALRVGGQVEVVRQAEGDGEQHEGVRRVADELEPVGVVDALLLERDGLIDLVQHDRRFAYDCHEWGSIGTYDIGRCNTSSLSPHE